MRVRPLVAVAALALGGCSAVLDFHECGHDDDCKARAPSGVTLYCSEQHQCINEVPSERLCQQMVPDNGAPPPANALAVAGLYKLTTGSGTNDHALRQAVDLAAQDLYKNAGVPIALYDCDTAGTAAQAYRALERMVSAQHVVAVVGPSTSDELLAPVERFGGGNLAGYVSDLKHPVVLVSPSATSPTISTLQDNGLIWRTAPSDTLQAEVLASQIPTMSTATPPVPLTLDLVSVDGPYGKGLHDAFIAAWTRNGNAVKTDIIFESGEDLNAKLKDVPAPDQALLIADADAPALIKAINGLATWSKTKLWMTDSAKAPTLWGPAGAQIPMTTLSRIQGTAPASHPPDKLPSGAGNPNYSVFTVFANSYKAVYSGEDPSNTAFVANAYDAFYLLAIAASAVPTGQPLTGVTIAAQMKRLSHSANNSPIAVGLDGYGQAKMLLHDANVDVDLLGASGPIDLDPNTGDVLSGPFEIWHIETGPTFVSTIVNSPGVVP